jgi:RNA polymerase sigma-70 factor (ECF subfamily)
MVSYKKTGMHAAQQQDQRLPFAEVVTLHQKVVYGYLLRFTRSLHDAQDLFQETFLRAHRAYTGLPADADHRAWLMRIAINLSKNYVRDRQRRSRVLVGESDHAANGMSPVQASRDTEEMMISRETAHVLITAIEALPFRQRAALVQRQFEGLDYQAIADNLECSPESARAHVYQALRKLRLSLHNPASQTKED